MKMPHIGQKVTMFTLNSSVKSGEVWDIILNNGQVHILLYFQSTQTVELAEWGSTELRTKSGERVNL
jgi:hypothetical protein